MLNFNQVVMIGHLTRDPELKTLPSGSTVCNFTIASNRQFVVNGEKKEETTFVDCECFGKSGEVIAKFMNKGRPIFIIGKLKQNSWTDDQGNKKSRLVIWVDNFEFVDSNKDKINATDVASVVTPDNVVDKPVATKRKVNKEPDLATATSVAVEQVPF
jgi:single stranded DNA-binding protein